MRHEIVGLLRRWDLLRRATELDSFSCPDLRFKAETIARMSKDLAHMLAIDDSEYKNYKGETNEEKGTS